MRVAVYGATGMIGSGVLRECLLDPDVSEVLAIGRRKTGKSDPKLRELALPNLRDYSAIQGELVGIDACLFCLGISSVGLNEQQYTEITYEYALAAAHALLLHNPGLTFVFISGGSTDSTEQGPVMWARVKGKTENALLALPFKGVYVFRPAFVQPMHGERSTSTSLNVLYTLMSPLVPLFRMIFPKFFTTTERVGRAMLHVAKRGAEQRLFENWELDKLA